MNTERILKKYVRNEINREKMKTFLDSISKNPETQTFILYEAFCHEGISDVREILKTRQFMFSHRDFTDIHNLVKEQEDFLNNPVQVEDGVIECHRCKSHKTFSYAKQTRASDEGTTVFVTCAECKFQFRL
jgi:DNA-directed RNA polymerase subunit M/transcription elongation factor TFIIS